MYKCPNIVSDIIIFFVSCEKVLNSDYFLSLEIVDDSTPHLQASWLQLIHENTYFTTKAFYIWLHFYGGKVLECCLLNAFVQSLVFNLSDQENFCHFPWRKFRFWSYLLWWVPWMDGYPDESSRLQWWLWFIP